MIAKGRFGFELVDGDANGHANVEQVRRDALPCINKAANNKKCLFNNKDGISASTSSFAPNRPPDVLKENREVLFCKYLASCFCLF